MNWNFLKFFKRNQRQKEKEDLEGALELKLITEEEFLELSITRMEKKLKELKVGKKCG